MARNKTIAKQATAIVARALALEGAEEGVACEGTALEKRTVRVGGRAFLFVGVKDDAFDVMLKLDESLAAAKALAATDPRIKVGANGWTSAKFAAGEAPPPNELGAWIEESYATLLTHKKAPVKSAPKTKKAPAKAAPKANSPAAKARARPSAKR
jgi:hypothetical protein